MARDRELTPLQRAFCEARARVSTATQAARAAGYSGTDRALSVAGARLMKDTRFRAEVARLRAENASASTGTAMPRDEAVRVLSAIARDAAQPVGARVRAIRELGLLEGWYPAAGEGTAPPEVHVHGGGQAVIVWRGNGRGPEPSGA